MPATAVLVTGAGSGIGLAIVQALLAAGHEVFAGARRAEHLQALSALGAQALELDVTDPQQVQAAADAIAQGSRGLHAVVHNAGVGGTGVLQSWPDDDVRALFETNVYGPLRLTRAVLPLLLAKGWEGRGGRVVCIGSQGGSITSPGMGPYTMSKHALEAYADCLRQELAPHGVAVSIVQPGAVATDIGANGRAGTLARLKSTPPPFDQGAAAQLVAMNAPRAARPDEPESASNRRHAPPSAVAAVVLQALFDEQPQARYLVGTRWESERVMAALLTRLIDAATSPSQAMDLDGLQQRLQQAWEAQQGRATKG